MLTKFKKYQFLFEELVKRDFKQKYKRTILGMGWSLLSPLLQLFIMSIIFKQFFGRGMEHYTIYLFCGNLVFSYYKESTNGGMNALMSNSRIFTKVNVPKYMFLFSKNVSSLINFGLTLIIFFIFVIADGVPIGIHFAALIYPILCLIVFNIGIGLILSALFVFFRDIAYLYDIFTMLLMYMSAVFYTVESMAPWFQKAILLNPVYIYIKYFRVITLEGHLPSLNHHILCLAYALIALAIGCWFYKKYNHKFLYYV